MLCIKNVSAKNFMSVGNNTQAVNFDSGQLTLVLGHNLDTGGDGSRNGTGKTTIINALSYALYGEALTNIKKDNLINKTNGKHMLTTVEFAVDGVDYRIERGRKPSVLKFFVNGTETIHEEQQGDSRETQKAIDRIVGFPHTMFKHLVALNTYSEPFLSMRASDQRDLIEQLLGITDLSLKADVLKEKIRLVKEQIREEEIQIATIKESNQRIEQNITELEKRSAVWENAHEQKILHLGTAILDLEEIDVDQEIQNIKTISLITDNNTRITSLKAELVRLNSVNTRSEKTIQSLQADLQSAQNGVCPSCGQGTAHLETHEEYIQEILQKLADEQRYCDENLKKITQAQTELDGIPVQQKPETFYQTLEQALEHKHNLENLKQQLEQRVAEQNPYLEQISMLRESGLQQISFDLMNELTDLRDHQEFLHRLLTSKDSFVRKKIIDQNITYLNHRLSHYLEKLGLPHLVQFGNDLSVEITEYGRELDFDNLSRGERNRLILGLSWAFRDLYESLNRPMNLLVVDELIDNGLDQNGVESALAVLKRMNRDHNKNIFLVSHREELQGRVNSILNVVKEGGFTMYNTDLDFVS
jgi:DNA repair exonuclease SbcCD ATPase subunit